MGRVPVMADKLERLVTDDLWPLSKMTTRTSPERAAIAVPRPSRRPRPGRAFAVCVTFRMASVGGIWDR
jgi:hypothetical protein